MIQNHLVGPSDIHALAMNILERNGIFLPNKRTGECRMPRRNVAHAHHMVCVRVCVCVRIQEVVVGVGTNGL